MTWRALLVGVGGGLVAGVILAIIEIAVGLRDVAVPVNLVIGLLVGIAAQVWALSVALNRHGFRYAKVES